MRAMHTMPTALSWVDGRWQADVALEIDAAGRVAGWHAGARGGGDRWLLPGLANLHSHAFQRAMAGLAEHQTDPRDSFWTWRETMYGFAGRITPEALRDIAAQLYVEMLEAGYTSVCEFHYLHHAPDGRPYADPAAMSHALIEAARETGIGLTLLPVLYMTGGFDGRALAPRQQRFGHTVEAYLALLERLAGLCDHQIRLGVAFHSLRAVPPEALAAVCAWLGARDWPVHIHIAEQVAEVDDCLAQRGARPVRWLLDHAPVDARWGLVHATHLDDAEVRGLAASGATAVLCPTTEANLGDGLFPLRAYLDAGGAWGIGSDSHVSVSAVEELRWLEYGQRLVTRRRCIAADPGQPSVGARLFTGALQGGRLVSGQPAGALAVGERADWITLDPQAPQLAPHGPETLLDAWVFAGNRPLVREVAVGGRVRVQDGRHLRREAIAARYLDTLRRLRRAD